MDKEVMSDVKDLTTFRYFNNFEEIVRINKQNITNLVQPIWTWGCSINIQKNINAHTSLKIISMWMESEKCRYWYEIFRKCYTQFFKSTLVFDVHFQGARSKI